ncbi:NADP-dependent oxidoreductase [Streptoalloteichus hindustanus]|uniref:NADPH:quinone reductase n=1 Tax=Streptoalloteichus hindustanus TaxID=2017 RepID=A0A1M4ZBX5_STRHI|nr:NADP-dependent oxidoreductase [Streptoalloteichus hindustanus]SHF15539.1 NADPH:quinone reductase [Streptoalloteichus hindustanus]
MPRALQYSEYGGPEVLRLVDIDLPEPAAGQVRIRARAAGVNPIDWKMRNGFYAQGEPLAAPAGSGFEVSGVIDAVGPDVDGWAVGQAVFGQIRSGGAVATHVLAPVDSLVARPDWLDDEQAAALPVVVETAYRTLRELGLRSGHTLLVHSAAGGVGLVASQLARVWGASVVVGTASERNHAYLRELGVVPVDYAGDDLLGRIRAAAPQGVDLVLDGSGRGVLPLSVELTGSPDKVISIADGRAAEHGVRFSAGGPFVPAMTAVLPLLENGTVRVPVEHVYPLDRAVDAYRLSEGGHVRGKIVIRIED